MEYPAKTSWAAHYAQQNALEARQRRRLQNRARIVSEGSDRDRDDTPTDELDFERSPQYQYNAAEVPDIFQQRAWYGSGAKVEEVPYNRIGAAQDTVSAARVQQIRKNPEMGTDPRFPWQERPLAIRSTDVTTDANTGEIHDNDYYTVLQGHHREAARMIADRPEMFHQLLTLKEDDINSGAVQQRYAGYRQLRAAREADADDKHPGGRYGTGTPRGPAVLRDEYYPS